MSYRIELQPSARGDFGKLPTVVREKVAARIDALANTPFPHDMKALTGDLRGSYRIPVAGKYRIGYDVDHDAQLISVWAIGRRDRFYDVAKRRRRA